MKQPARSAGLAALCVSAVLCACRPNVPLTDLGQAFNPLLLGHLSALLPEPAMTRFNLGGAA